MSFILFVMAWFGLSYGIRKKSLLKGVAAGVFFFWPLVKFLAAVVVVGVGLAHMATVALVDWGFAKPKPRVKVRPASFERPLAARMAKHLEGRA